MAKKTNIVKDKLIDTLLGNKVVIVILIVLLILTRHYSRNVLNLPSYVNWLKFGFAACGAVCFMIARIMKYKAFYRKALKDSADIVIQFLQFIAVGGVCWLIINVALSFLIVTRADKPVLVYTCKITMVSKAKGKQIYYLFKGNRYAVPSPYIENPENLKEQYDLQIDVSRSVFDTYILHSSHLEEKVPGTVYD